MSDLRERGLERALDLLVFQLVRAAARYVFRHHDEVIKQVASAYQRRRRAAARRRSTDEVVTPPSTPTPAIVAPAPIV